MMWASVVLAIGTLVTLGLLVRAFIGDRSRGRRRCPSCWYDMGASPAPGLVCSECGKDAKRESRLFKSRRRARVFVVSFLPLILGVGVYAAWLGQQPDWFRRAPGIVLVAASPWMEQQDKRGEELFRRPDPRKEYTLASWERWVLERVSHGVVRSGGPAERVVFHAFLLVVMHKDDEATATALLKLLGNPDAYVVRRAALLLSSMAPSEEVETALVALTEHADPDVQQTAMLSLGFFKREQPGGRPPELLYKCATETAGPYERALACSALGLFDANERSRALLLRAAESGAADPGACERATGALTRHYPDDARVRELVLLALRDPARVDATSSFVERIVEADRWFVDDAGQLTPERRALYSDEVRAAVVAAAAAGVRDDIMWDMPRYLLRKASWLTEEERGRVPPPVTPEAELAR